VACLHLTFSRLEPSALAFDFVWLM